MMTPTLASDRAARARCNTAVLATDERHPPLLLRAGGFTLLELMLVMAIIAMAGFILVPGLGGLETRTFNARVREAHTLLNLARRSAVVSGQPSVARFSVAPDAVDQAPLLSSFSVGQWDGSGIALTFQDSADQEIEVQEVLDITFFPEGGSTGGSLLLADQDRLASIVINPFTGRVETEFLDER